MSVNPPISGRFSFGCEDYEAWVIPRGGGTTGLGRLLPNRATALGRLTGWDNITYTPGQLNAVSTATVKIPNLAQVDPACCGLIGQLRNWEHELSIRRGSDGEVWVGPIVQRQVSGGSLTITAYDLSKWLERRFLHDDYSGKNAIKGMPALTLYAKLWHDAIDVDNSMNAVLTLGKPTGELLDFTYTPNRIGKQTADQALRQTGISAVDFYTKLRETHAGKVIQQFASSSPLIDDWVVGTYDTDSDGSAEVNDLVIQGTNRGGKQIAAEARASTEIRRRKGVLEAYESDQTLQTIAACQAAAKDLLNLYDDSPNTVSSLVLSPRAPYRLSELAPGYLLDVRLARLCQSVFGIYRIQQVTISVDQSQNNGMEVATVALQYVAATAQDATTGPV